MTLTAEQIDWAAVSRDFASRFKSAEEAKKAVLEPWLPLIPPTCVLTSQGELKPRLNKYIPVTPTEKQAQFLMLNELDAFYGGSAGSGKSIALLSAAAQFFDVPNYNALIFRKSFSELSLPGALMDMARKWWPEYQRDNGKIFRFPTGNGGYATLTFGYLETSDDKNRYQSAQFAFIGADEVTEFNESDFTFMFSRLRNPPPGVPLRMRCASNPNGIGRLWVKRRYVDAVTREARVFVPAFLDDNYFLEAKEEYKRNLAHELGPVESAQLLAGDWEVQAAGKFRRQWFKILQVAPAEMRFVRYWDFAATEAAPGKDPSWTVGALMGTIHGEYVLVDIRRARLTPKGVEDLVLQTASTDRQRFGNVAIRLEQEPGSSGVNVVAHYARLLAGYDFRADKVTGPKEIRANALASQAEAGNVYLLSANWNKEFLDECVIEGADVTTANGDVPIESVKIGDDVLTRDGWNKVLFADFTGHPNSVVVISLADGKSIRVTANHPVFVVGRGFVPASTIRQGDKLLCLRERQSFIRGRNLSDTLTARHGSVDSISAAGGIIRKPISIGSYMKRYMVRYPRDSMLTTLTGIRSTMSYQISDCFQPQNITSATGKIDQNANLNASSAGMLYGPSTRQPQCTALAFAPMLQEKYTENCAPEVANGAIKDSTLLSRIKSIARSYAHRDTITRSSRHGQGSALSAINRFIPKCQNRFAVVAVAVSRLDIATGGRVFNLKVANQSEYFVNGVLVHNCEVFPGGGHSDQVDSTSGAFNELTGVPPVNTRGIFMVGERLRPDW